MIDPFVQYVVSAAAIVTAAATTGTFGVAASLWLGQRQHGRTLYGAEQDDEWNGLVERVAKHREMFEEEGKL